ncbi:uncharacterized mitochondrial protein AtMg00820-like [Ricinus communis]|uniref:uncharacterized mitochondrial protein AtMg00820-like n=1 Tax=Ricinus communis TaxID=3988 RepID=UPI00201B1B15|nr:uncharacterized mitochondrial protein AtMg00820-like [Ricinus communis]
MHLVGWRECKKRWKLYIRTRLGSLCHYHKGRKAIGNKWVFKIKRNSDDQVERFRARMVVKGYAQKEGIDFNEIFSPVVRLTTARVVLVMYDMLVAGPNKDHIEELKAQLARKFEMKDLGP